MHTRTNRGHHTPNSGLSRRLFLKGAAAGALGCAVGLPRVSRALAQASPAEVEILRTLVAHEITNWEPGVNEGYGGAGEQAPIISGDGRFVAFGRTPGSGDPANPNRIFVMGSDGSGEREVDAYTTLVYAGSMIDISDDGATVVSTDSVQIRVADSAGGGGRELISLASNEINAVRISGDGQTVIFRVYRDTATREGGDPVPRGLYVADVAGGGWRQVAGPADLAPILDVPVDQVPFFGASFGLDASTDGSRIVFGMYNAPEPGGLGQSLMSVNADGSGLTDLFGRVAFVQNGAISGDGETIAYITVQNYGDVEEAGVVAFGGGDRRLLADSSRTATGIGMSMPTGGRIQLNQDGTRLLLGYTGLLYDTTDGTVLQLGVRGGYWSTDAAPLVADDLIHPTMTTDATRFLYFALDAQNRKQLATLDLDPADLGAAPLLADPMIDTPSIAAGTDEKTTLSVAVAADAELLRVASATLLDGRLDGVVYPTVLIDDGAVPDSAAGDGVFTSLLGSLSSEATPGPRTIRFRAEARGADGRRHSTSIEIAGLTVDAPPTA